MSIPSGTDGRKMEQMAGKWNGWQENGMDGNEIEKPIVLTPQIAGHNLKNKLGLIKFGNDDNRKKKIYT